MVIAVFRVVAAEVRRPVFERGAQIGGSFCVAAYVAQVAEKMERTAVLRALELE